MSQKQSSSRKEIYKLQANFCKALAHPIRLEILDLLYSGEKTVTQLVEYTGFPQSTISQHLAFLRQLRVVKTRREGVKVYYSLAYPELKEACNIIREIIQRMLRDLSAVSTYE